MCVWKINLCYKIKNLSTPLIGNILSIQCNIGLSSDLNYPPLFSSSCTMGNYIFKKKKKKKLVRWVRKIITPFSDYCFTISFKVNTLVYYEIANLTLCNHQSFLIGAFPTKTPKLFKFYNTVHFFQMSVNLVKCNDDHKRKCAIASSESRFEKTLYILTNKTFKSIIKGIIMNIITRTISNRSTTIIKRGNNNG